LSAVVLLPATTEIFAAVAAVDERDPVTAAASVVVVGVVAAPLAMRTVEPAAEIAAGADATTVHVAAPVVAFSGKATITYVPATSGVNLTVAKPVIADVEATQSIAATLR
jgi:hypothetical protein